uniref:Uncharacterized protein n=1 Tax=Sinocyclocheilus anshuiensis TaxID=1608454 RepID=A0A671P4H2_9TELE
MRLFIVSVLTVLLALIFPSAMPEVVRAFTKCREFFYKEQPPVIPGILDSRSLENNYKEICQKYRNVYRFATFYDTANRIPVFSAYKYTGLLILRPSKNFFIETDLDKCNYFNSHERVNRGHLFPCSYAPDKLTAESTFTLTNIVPQKNSFNSGSWNRMENEIIETMNKYCYDDNDNNRVLAYMLTGAIPGDTKLNERVNIPSYMWMAFCCYNRTGNSWVSQAYWAKNVGEDINKGKTISKKSLQDLQEFLSQTWKKKVTLFNNNCTKKHTTH